MSRRVVAVLAVLALLALATVAGVVAWRAFDRTAYEQAVRWLPAETLRATYTDWAQVRALADGGDVDPGSSRAVDAFLERAYDLDLTSTSAVADSTFAMAENYGFSPLAATWEAYAQSREGAVVLLRLGDAVDLPAVEDALRELGYDAPPDGAGTGGVWAGSADLVAQIDPALTPVLQNVAVLEDERLVLLSDSPDYLARSVGVVGDDEPGLSQEVAGVRDLADVVEEPVAAVLFASDFACEALSMASADSEDQVVAERLVAESGDISPLSGLVMAHQPDRTLTVAMHFEDSDRAEENLRARVRLASGEAVGQGGVFADRFSISSARTSGDDAVLQLEPRAGDESTLLSDLSQGPVLFATC